MNGISYVDKSLIKASRNRTDELIRQNELTKASELCDEIIYRIGNDTAYSSIRYKLPYFDTLILKSRIHARKDSLMQALYETKKAVGFLNDNFPDILLNVPRTEREEAWDFYNHWYMNFIPMMASLTTDEVMLRRAYEAMLNGKGLLLNTELAVRNAIYQSGDSIAISLLDKSNSLADQLSRLASERNNNVEERERKMDELREEYQKVGEEIAARSEFYARNSSMTNINFGDVAESLGKDEAAIEFVSVKSDDFRSPPAYFALILRKGYAYPSMIRLGDSETIERLATENPYRTTDLFNAVWQPLLPYLTGISTVYFSPAGILQTTGIEHLPVDDDGTVIGDSLNLHRVSSTKEIVYHKRSNEGDIAPGAGIFYGGIDYDLSDNMAHVSAADDMAALSIADRASYRSSIEMPVFRSSFNGFIDRSSISPLYGTAEEIRNILPFAKNIDILDSIIFLTGSHATEEKFKDMAQRHPKLLHIATHGFYFTEEELAEMAEEDFVRSISTAERDIDDIDLLRSGLIFAGVNNLVAGTDLPENADDGILTAKEISLLNLSDVDIAILSACQTALGDIGTDGVMGLQRGFKKAGTQSLLMSLWNVDDKATSVFMTEFYRQFSASGDKAMALREARKYLRGYEDGIYDHPHFWAAFILLDGL